VSIYEKRHLRKHRRLLPLQAGEFRSAEQLTPEQEKALHDALDRLAGERFGGYGRRAEYLLVGPMSQSANAIRSALRIRRSHQLVGEMFRRSSAVATTAPANWVSRS
jgi:hypothetical protein